MTKVPNEGRVGARRSAVAIEIEGGTGMLMRQWGRETNQAREWPTTNVHHSAGSLPHVSLPRKGSEPMAISI